MCCNKDLKRIPDRGLCPSFLRRTLWSTKRMIRPGGRFHRVWLRRYNPLLRVLLARLDLPTLEFPTQAVRRTRGLLRRMRPGPRRHRMEVPRLLDRHPRPRLRYLQNLTNARRERVILVLRPQPRPSSPQSVPSPDPLLGL